MQAYLTGPQEFELEGFHCTYRIRGIQNRNKSRNNKIRSPACAETDFIIPQDRNVYTEYAGFEITADSAVALRT